MAGRRVPRVRRVLNDHPVFARRDFGDRYPIRKTPLDALLPAVGDCEQHTFAVGEHIGPCVIEFIVRGVQSGEPVGNGAGFCLHANETITSVIVCVDHSVGSPRRARQSGQRVGHCNRWTTVGEPDRWTAVDRRDSNSAILEKADVLTVGREKRVGHPFCAG